MSFDRVSGGVVLVLLGIILGVSGIVLIKADGWWLNALGFPCVAFSCDAWTAVWKRVLP